MANNQPSEQEIQFRKRARRRLVGAVALVLLMITVLPMVLDDQQGPETPLPEVAISIPSQEGEDFTSRIEPVEPAPEPKPSAAPAVEEATQAEETIEVPAKAPETPAAPVAEKPAPAPPGKFSVQFGVFTSSGNAAKLQNELANKGVETYTENVKSGSGTRTGVRMGHFATRAEAEQALEPLKALGIKGIVVSN